MLHAAYTREDIDRMNAALAGAISAGRFDIKRETVRGGCDLVAPDGRRLVMLREQTSYDDWHEVKGWGRCNFGKVYVGKWRYVVEHPDGRQEPSSPEHFYATALSQGAQEEPLKRVGFMKWLFG